MVCAPRAVGGESPPWISEVNATAAPPFPPERPPSPPNTHGCVPLVAKCDYGCSEDGNGVCDDGGPGAQYSRCWLGTDCSDCGERHIGAQYCTDECSYANDGACDDGGAGAEYELCASLNFPPSPPPTGPPPPYTGERRVTTDCTDCGGTVDRFCAPPSAPPRAVFTGASGGRRMGASAEPGQPAEKPAEPGKRKLLKGGGRRFGGSFGSTGCAPAAFARSPRMHARPVCASAAHPRRIRCASAAHPLRIRGASAAHPRRIRGASAAHPLRIRCA